MLEDGEISDRNAVKELMKNGVIPEFQKYNSDGTSIKRINHIEVVKVSFSKNTAWISYRNTAEFLLNGDFFNKMGTIESAILVKDNKKWKMLLLHSSPMKIEDTK
ncbi:hypothetical protein [Kaistella sp.]|uniref:hypothetical protein n=1 Tax=Kaistella sp. TaxID=2782235 RepID=UPI003C65A33A